MGIVSPRAVLVTRATDYELVVARHGTRAQAEFFLKGRGQTLEAADQRHAKQKEAEQAAAAAIPRAWRRTHVARSDLCRFVFDPTDVIVVVGQDGLVANVAKYLRGQPVIGINPDKASYDGVLVKHAPKDAKDLFGASADGRAREERTMVEARLDDGQRLLAINEIFVGHRSHQSARYRLRAKGLEERHSSSGAVVATGTGATGWARSIHRERVAAPPMPSPTEPGLAFFVREAFPSVATQTSLTQGLLTAEEALEITSEMNEAGVVFGDGIEDDRLEFPWGMRARIAVAKERLCLVA
ncbi:MAG: NAD(+)/NADH kinase [Myxococcales bacterium]|nr:NAD(+)/NADH kinase [Myxococcales bacterium]